MHCPYCGNIVTDGAHFCPYCGRKLPEEFLKAAAQMSPTQNTQAPAPVKKVVSQSTVREQQSDSQQPSAPTAGAPVTQQPIPQKPASVPTAHAPTTYQSPQNPPVPQAQTQLAQTSPQPAAQQPQQASSPQPAPAPQSPATSRAAATSAATPASQPNTPTQPLAQQVPQAPAMPRTPMAVSRFATTFQRSNPWQSILLSLLLGLGGALILAFIATIIATSVAGQIPGYGQYFHIGFSTWLTVFFLHASTGTFVVHGITASASLPMGLGAIALFLGSALGAHMGARKASLRFKWVGATGAAIVALATGIVFLLVGSASLTADGEAMRQMQGMISIGGDSGRTFLGSFLTSGLGALAGYGLASAVPDKSNLFSAFHAWWHRCRGWARMAIEVTVILGSLLAILSLVTLVVSIFQIDNGENGLNRQIAAGIAMLLLPGFLIDIASVILGGGLTFTGYAGVLIKMLQTGEQSDQPTSATFGMWTFNNANPYFSSWVNVIKATLIISLIIFAIGVLYVGCRAGARNLYDPSKARWGQTWQAPLLIAVAGYFNVFLYANLDGGGYFQGQGGYAGLEPASWVPLLMAAWVFLAEVIGMTFGRNMVLAMPGVWRIFLPGCVEVVQAPGATTPPVSSQNATKVE